MYPTICRTPLDQALVVLSLHPVDAFGESDDCSASTIGGRLALGRFLCSQTASFILIFMSRNSLPRPSGELKRSSAATTRISSTNTANWSAKWSIYHVLYCLPPSIWLTAPYCVHYKASTDNAMRRQQIRSQQTVPYSASLQSSLR